LFQGEVTLGWDFTTNTKASKHMAPKKVKELKPGKLSFDLPQYMGPQRLVEKSLSDRKEAAEQQKQALAKLVDTYGEAGAAEILRIEELKATRGPPVVYKHRKYHLSKAEKQAVVDLPDFA
jgi:hypothetical protein